MRLVAVVLSAVAVGALTGCLLGPDAIRAAEQQHPVLPQSPGLAVDTNQPGAARQALAGAALRRQERALRDRDRRGYLRTWDSALTTSRRSGATVYTNLRALGAAVTSIRYVTASVGGLSPRPQRLLGGSSGTAEVELSWRLRHFDERAALTTLAYTFVQRGDKAYVVDIEPATGARRPVWLLGQLVVRRSERTLVAATTRAAAVRVDRLLRQAADDVASVVPDWRGRLVAYLPADAEQLESVLAAPPGAYDTIAAVTTTVDGSPRVDAPVVIVVNPGVFAELSPVGARVVITHESTHVATGATAVDVPLWLAEGFADYVGVGSVDVPLSVSAGAVLRDIRRNGLPRALPADPAFDSARGNLEVYYGQARLAAKLIAKTYGEARLLAFYDRVVAAPNQVGRALRTELGTNRAELTDMWRSYLEAIASAR